MDTNRSRREEALRKCANISNQTTSYDVKQTLISLVYASIPGASIRQHDGYFNENHQIISFNMPNDASNWVVIISNDVIRERGHNCLKVYHLSHAIDFFNFYTSPFRNLSFYEGYARLCEIDCCRLYRYSIYLSPEALVSEMLANLAQS